MTEQEYIAVAYHAIFHYQLTKNDLQKWMPGTKLGVTPSIKKSLHTKKLTLRTDLRNITPSLSKMKIAKNAALHLQKIPTLLFVGVTGSLAMNHANEESDIDLFIITKANTLWFTRVWTTVILIVNGFKLRTAKNKDEKDKLCMNLWLDERAMNLPTIDKNAYTAHELCQIIPLVNKKQIYERLMNTHHWVRDYWPKVTFKKYNQKNKGKANFTSASLLNTPLYWFQKLYMHRKMTRESVSLHHAYFHPFDWGEKVMGQLTKSGIRQR